MCCLFLSQLQELIACSIPIFDKKEGNGTISRTVTLEEIVSKENPITHAWEPTTISSITITGIPEKAFIFKVDCFSQPQALFNDIKDVRKRADYILLAEEKNKKRAVFIEMKRTKDTENNIKAQLRGAACILDYCNSVLKRFWKGATLTTKFDERFVSCSHNSRKNGSIDPKMPIHDTPDKLLKLNGSTFTYQQLIRK